MFIPPTRHGERRLHLAQHQSGKSKTSYYGVRQNRRMVNWLRCRRCGSLTLDNNEHAKQSSAGSFEFVLGFERLYCQHSRGQTGPVEDPLILLGARLVARRISDRRRFADGRPAHTPSDPAPGCFRLSFFPAAFRCFSIKSFASMSTSLGSCSFFSHRRCSRPKRVQSSCSRCCRISTSSKLAQARVSLTTVRRMFAKSRLNIPSSCSRASSARTHSTARFKAL